MAEEPDETPIDPSPPPTVPPRKRRLGRLFFYGFLALWLLTALWNLFKPLPEGVSVRGEIVDTPLNQMRFLCGCDRCRRVRRAGGAPADLRCRARADRRRTRIPGARFLPVQQPARRGDRRQAASRIVRRAARRAAGAQTRDAATEYPGDRRPHQRRLWRPAVARSGGAARRGHRSGDGRPRLPARFEPYLLLLLAADHELVVGRRLRGRQPSESARCRARTA